MLSSRGVVIALLSVFVPFSSAGPIRLRAEQVATPGDATYDYVGRREKTLVIPHALTHTSHRWWHRWSYYRRSSGRVCIGRRYRSRRLLRGGLRERERRPFVIANGN